MARAFIPDTALAAAPREAVDHAERILLAAGARTVRDSARDGTVVLAPLRACCDLVDLLGPA